ncbi:hypothetical protein ACFQY5_36200 [Paeniroseomonas aquatica]|uniref:Uncharacterized protein n=1 Tax=Paeniroseomonas aquatica TaxID=373043 RepID=A0ABT8AG08_9PROT|nr:hypothetical protein [Paeniroseomonas aquatica]
MSDVESEAMTHPGKLKQETPSDSSVLLRDWPAGNVVRLPASPTGLAKCLQAAPRLTRPFTGGRPGRACAALQTETSAAAQFLPPGFE